MLLEKSWLRCLLALAFAVPVALASSFARAQSWANVPAELTVAEYLQFVFDQEMRRPDSDALNSFSLVSFYPSSDPNSALVLVIQSWHDERIPNQNLRREIRKVGEALTSHFEAIARHPRVLKRWRTENSKVNFVVRHVRISDFKETLAVTVEGQTLFEADDVAKTKADVIRRGGVWGW